MIPPEIPHCWYFEGDDTDAQGRIANITVTFDNDFLDRCSGTFPELRGHIIFANKAEPKTLNRATGIVLVVLGVVIFGFSILK